ncbi:hypothetical protein SmJEL517_g04247 [Synchytrium microbalum]|uniref:Rgp1-domain-containing protein n=1 Tax=Synchytrium microbalum TaxID=1806994 RepID=A0A507BT01_9FUNG|nr:uncharacterized protein SmJEL517_g04247 [Synchytrium microbalum]TPX32710.1 hypothetical protein SmJEL517_g04247 [Synchytrium microbalum]
MVVLLTVNFPKEGVFFAGEAFTCSLTFSNVSSVVSSTSGASRNNSIASLPKRTASLVHFGDLSSIPEATQASSSTVEKPTLNILDKQNTDSKHDENRTTIQMSSLNTTAGMLPGSPAAMVQTRPTEFSNRNGTEVYEKENTVAHSTSNGTARNSLHAPNGSISHSVSQFDEVDQRKRLYNVAEPFEGYLPEYSQPFTPLLPRRPSQPPSLPFPSQVADSVVDHSASNPNNRSDKHGGERLYLRTVVSETSGHNSIIASPTPTTPSKTVIENGALPVEDHLSEATVSPNRQHRPSLTTRTSTDSLASSLPGHVYQQSSTALHPPTSSQVEEITLGFAQMSGSFTLDGSTVKLSAFDELKKQIMYRPVNGFSSGPGGGGSLFPPLGPDNNSRPTGAKTDKSLPLYTTPPSILFANLSLASGESRTYRYEIKLPSSLPPSHRGKLIRISYKLLVGIQRFGGGRRNQIIQLPFRLFGSVEEDGVRSLFDLLTPVVKTKDEATIIDEFEESRRQVKTTRKLRPLKSASQDNLETETPSMAHILYVCQAAGRVSYQICRDTHYIAHLHLLRNRYRLGESIMGVLSFASSAVPCYQVSLYLETIEAADQEFSLRRSADGGGTIRKSVAESHVNATNSKRLGIQLAIPLTAAPDFATSVVSVSWSLRLVFIIANVAKKKGEGDFEQLVKTPGPEAFRHSQARNRVDTEVFECIVPITVYGTMSGGGGTKGNTLYFEIV